MFFCITGLSGRDCAVRDGNFMKIRRVSLQLHTMIRIQKMQLNSLPIQLLIFARYMNKTLLYSTKLAITNVHLGGYCSNIWYFAKTLHVCKPVCFSATFGTAVIWKHSLVFEDVSWHRKESGRKERNKEEKGMEGWLLQDSDREDRLPFWKGKTAPRTGK